MATYLFAWNPKKWHWDNLDEQSETVMNDHSVMEPWSVANRNAQKGDRALAVDLGKNQRVYLHREPLSASHI